MARTGVPRLAVRMVLCRIVGSLGGFDAPQQMGRDVPLLLIVGEDGGGFFVQANNGPAFALSRGIGEVDAVADAKLGQSSGAMGLVEELKSIDDQPVEQAQFVAVHVLDRPSQSLTINALEVFFIHTRSSYRPRGSFFAGVLHVPQ